MSTPRLPRLFTRSLNYLRRGVNPAHSALRADALLGSDCEGSSPTAHIQNRLAGFQARQIDHLLAKGSLPAEPYHPKQKVTSEAQWPALEIWRAQAYRKQLKGKKMAA